MHDKSAFVGGVQTGLLGARTANNNDINAVRDLIYSILDEYGLPPDPRGTDRDLEDLEEHYMARGGLFEVVEDTHGRVLGTAGIYPLDEQRCELRKMYLAPELRGQGWGKAILCRMIRKAQELGFEEMELETASVLIEAIGLYRSFGFEPRLGKIDVERCDKAFWLKLTDYEAPVDAASSKAL